MPDILYKIGVPHEVLVSVEGINFIYVKDTKISMPNSTQFTTTFQSSTPDVVIKQITVNGTAVSNGGKEVNITVTPNAKSGNITITSPLPENFLAKDIAFQVANGAGLTQNILSPNIRLFISGRYLS
mgnify:CR=1 FL=1